MGKVLTLGIRLDSRELVAPAKQGEAALAAVGTAAVAAEQKVKKMATAGADVAAMRAPINRVAEAIARMQAETARTNDRLLATKVALADGFQPAPINRVAEAIRKMQIAAAKANDQAHANKLSLADPFQRAIAPTQGLIGSLGKLGGTASIAARALAAAGLALSVRQIAQYADEMTNLEGRLRLVTHGSGELRAVQSALLATANDTRTSYASTADLYARLARSTKDLHATQGDLLAVTKAINQGFVVSGASAQESSAALIQLGQAFASGTLRGDELRSVLEQAPRLAEAIATGLGVTVGKLRELGAEGKLTSKQVFDAIRGQADAIQKEFGQMPATIGGSVAAVGNSLLALLAIFDKTISGSGALARGLRTVAGVLQSIANSGAFKRGGLVGGLTGDHAEEEADSAEVRALNSLHALNVRRHADAHAIKEAKAAEALAIREATAAGDAELHKLIALNAAHGQSRLALEILAIKEDALAQKVENATKGSPAVVAALNKQTDAMTRQRIVAAELADRTERAADAMARLRGESERRSQNAGDNLDTVNTFLGNAREQLAPSDADVQNWLNARNAAQELGIGIKEVDAAMLALLNKKGGEKMKASIEEAMDASDEWARRARAQGDEELARWAQETKDAEAAARSTEQAFTAAFANVAARGKVAFADIFQFAGSQFEIGSLGATGGPFGAAFGTIVDSLLGSAEATREARRRYQTEINNWNAMLDSWVESTRNAGDSFAQSIQSINEKYDKAQRDLDAIPEEGRRRAGVTSGTGSGVGIDAEERSESQRKLNEARAAEIALVNEQRKAIERATLRSLDERIARARGDEVAAQQIRNQIELTAAANDNQRQMIELAQALEATAREAEKVAEAERKRAEEQRTLDNLTLEYLRLQGKDDEARQLAQQLRLADATSDAQKEILKLIFGLEDAADAAAKLTAEEAALLEIRRGIEDLDVRDLRSSGRDQDADFLQFQHDQERELANAIARAQGADSAGGSTVTAEEQAYIDHLRDTLANELNKWLADHAPAANLGTGYSAPTSADLTSSSIRGATSGQSIANLTIVQGDRAISELTQIRIGVNRLGRLIQSRGLLFEDSIQRDIDRDTYQSGNVVVS